MKKELYTKDNIETYNKAGKRVFAFTVILIFAIIIGLVLIYLFLLKDSNFFLIKILNSFFQNVSSNIRDGTILGALYASLFGGLFFVLLPMEAVFINFLKSGNTPLLLIAIFNVGFMISFTANYYIGMNLADTTKKVITAKKFYKIKFT